MIRITSGGEKILYRHGSSTCTVGTIDESIDRISIDRFLEIEGGEAETR
ncbi:hypothetical protein [Vulcanisaeta sp. JCM 16161]|nr:hypothetical protein [Vulcanisaeta sp. JCM 16161]